MGAPASITAIAAELGRARPIADLDEVRARPALAARLGEREGLRDFLETDDPPLHLALRAARRTLDDAGIAPELVGAVVFASDSLPPAHDVEGTAEVGALVAALGLPDAYPLNVTLSDCANLQIALRVAGALVRAGEYRHVLVVSVDVARYASPDTRLIGGGIAVASDAAASLLVSAGSGPLVIEAAAQRRVAATLDPQQHLVQRVRAHTALLGQVLAAGGVSPAGVRRVFPNHFARSALEPFFVEAGFLPAQLHRASAARVGHCFGSDCLIGLAAYLQEAPAAPGDRFLLVGAGVSQLGAVLLRAVS
jgi:3-oxoacyl-[acyl-carrier-protein] synthase-3